jgi:asparagine synthase (glutamine-hydrolysing)
MCGLNGIFAYQTAASDPARSELIATREHMVARGPDGAGEWWSKDRRLGLAFRRLAIQDLSARADQPMLSDDGRLAIVFNGEIYNVRELRADLERLGRAFRTTSDTEVVLHLYALEGEAMVRRLRGMFALAIWDEDRQGVFLARDPYGIKPLYTANDGWTFRFASQVKALLAGGGVGRDPEPAGVVGFHLFGSVPEPFTLYRDIRALPAGHTQWIDAAGPREPQPYVSIPAILAEGRETAAPPDTTARIREAVLDSVRAHLIADVEVGLFLSSGVDSGAILGLLRDADHGAVTAITLSYAEFEATPEDETPLAAEMAARYGARHIVRRVSGAEFRAELPAILEAMDQPSIDGVNSWYVTKAGREAGLKVALSGLGGDELLGGYPSFRDLPRWTALMRPLSAPGLGAGLRMLAGALAPQLRHERPKALGLAEFGGSWPGAYLLRRGLFLPFELSTQLDPDLVAEGMRRLQPVRSLARSLEPDPGSAFGRVSALESANYLKNQLLRDADWTGMAHSLEVRTPLVDIELLKALAPVLAGLPEGAGKRALVAAPSDPLPPDVATRAKSGFGVPLGDWLYPHCARRLAKGAISRRWAHDLWRNQTLATAA